MDVKHGPKMVVIGGGTGTFTVLSGLKHYVKHITALVNMADDGGSTGQLRDELGVLPPGDVRQCLVALSDNPKIRELFTYRFEEGTLKGHAFGNLFLTALEQMSGSFVEAVELASEVLKITGCVEPITLTDVTLCADGKDGQPIKGEFTIAHQELAEHPRVWLEPKAVVNPRAIAAIKDADLVAIAPGNLYGSLAPALVVPGIYEALCETKAKKVYICNLVTKPGPTHGFKVHDFAGELERMAGGAFLDYVIYNNVPPSEQLIKRYAHDGEYAVEVDEEILKTKHYKTKASGLISKEIWHENQSSDPLATVRSFIRHDPEQIARQLMKIYFS